jgi:peroxiredoxin
MTLQRELDAIRERELAKTPPKVLEIQRQAFDLLTATGTASGVVTVGAVAPDFELQGIDGTLVSLHELCRRGPSILSFFRGGWCPFCSMELRAYQNLVESIEALGASLVAISPEKPELLAQVAGDNELSFPVLSDRDNQVAHRYGLVYTVPEALRAIYEGFGLDLPQRHETTTFELPIPATYLVDRHCRIRRAFVNLDQTQRGEPGDFLQGLRELTAEASS